MLLGPAVFFGLATLCGTLATLGAHFTTHKMLLSLPDGDEALAAHRLVAWILGALNSAWVALGTPNGSSPLGGSLHAQVYLSGKIDRTVSKISSIVDMLHSTYLHPLCLLDAVLLSTTCRASSLGCLNCPHLTINKGRVQSGHALIGCKANKKLRTQTTLAKFGGTEQMYL